MKKILIIGLVIVISLSLIGCSYGEGDYNIVGTWEGTLQGDDYDLKFHDENSGCLCWTSDYDGYRYEYELSVNKTGDKTFKANYVLEVFGIWNERTLHIEFSNLNYILVEMYNSNNKRIGNGSFTRQKN